MTETSGQSQPDWAAGLKGFALAWGLPTAAMVLAIFVDPPGKTAIWLAALIWMGGACLWNARRCGRVHCYFTGPFLLAMTVPVALHGFAIVPFGPEGWRWLGIAIFAGAGGLWCLSEAVLGRYRGRSDKS